MNIERYTDELLARALQEGLDAAEIWYVEGDAFRVKAMKGAIEDYQLSSTCGLGFRGMWQGKTGYSSTQAFDAESIDQLIRGVKESAELTQTQEQDEIFAGDSGYPAYEPPANDLGSFTPEQKLELCLRLEKAIFDADSRVTQAKHPTLLTSRSSVTLKNTFGLHLHYEDSLWGAGAGAVMPRGDTVVDGWGGDSGHLLSQFDPDRTARKAAAEAAAQLDAQECESGSWHVILHRDAMRDLLSTFSGIFSARNAQQRLSLLKGREGQQVASGAVTIIDDPLWPGGFGSCPFDAEGSACRTKTVIDKGVLKTLLHNRKTARIQQVETTGNASRASYASPIGISPTNLYLQPGSRSPEELIAGLDRGLVITEVSGLHAGANPVSGDFSLLSKGYIVENGQRTHAVERFTVAGNFYRLLENIRETASDLEFEGTSYGACTTDAGDLIVSGK